MGFGTSLSLHFSANNNLAHFQRRLPREKNLSFTLTKSSSRACKFGCLLLSCFSSPFLHHWAQDISFSYSLYLCLQVAMASLILFLFFDFLFHKGERNVGFVYSSDLKMGFVFGVSNSEDGITFLSLIVFVKWVFGSNRRCMCSIGKTHFCSFIWNIKKRRRHWSKN